MINKDKLLEVNKIPYSNTQSNREAQKSYEDFKKEKSSHVYIQLL